MKLKSFTVHRGPVDANKGEHCGLWRAPASNVAWRRTEEIWSLSLSTFTFSAWLSPPTLQNHQVCFCLLTGTLWGTDNSCFVGYGQQLLCGCTDNSYFVGHRQQPLCRVQTTATLWVTLTDNSYFYFVGYIQQLLWGYGQQLFLLCGVQTTATLSGMDNSYLVGYRQRLLSGI